MHRIAKRTRADRRVAEILYGRLSARRQPFACQMTLRHVPATAALRRADRKKSCRSPSERIEGTIERRVLILCDHASNAVPAGLRESRPSRAELERHIAYDIGAAAVTRALARSLDATRDPDQVLAPRHRPEPRPRRPDPRDAPVRRRRGPRQRAASTRRRSRAASGASTILTTRRSGSRSNGRSAPTHPPLIVAIHSFTPFWRGLAAALACRDPVGLRRALRASAPRRPRGRARSRRRRQRAL